MSIYNITKKIYFYFYWHILLLTIQDFFLKFNRFENLFAIIIIHNCYNNSNIKIFF